VRARNYAASNELCSVGVVFCRTLSVVLLFATSMELATRLHDSESQPCGGVEETVVTRRELSRHSLHPSEILLNFKDSLVINTILYNIFSYYQKLLFVYMYVIK
jgi:hypothetical protein